MNVYDQLRRAQLEALAADPTPGLNGRIYWNTVSSRAMLDNGSATLAFITDKSKVSNYLDFAQVSAPASPASTFTRLYSKATDKLFFQNSSATEYEVATLTQTQTLTAKTFGDEQTLTQISTPSNPSAGFVKFYCKGDNNLYSLTSTGTENLIATSTSSQPPQQFIYNANLAVWPEGTSLTAANGATRYGPEGFYCKNSLGTNGILTISQTTASYPQSAFGCKVQITTAPTGSQANGCELYQTLENASSKMLYNTTVSFSVFVKAFGNVNQCGIQLFYKTTEGKVDTAIGSEVTATVITAQPTGITISGQLTGASMTVDGSIGIRIRITGVSSGNTYDLNNGFSFELPILNVGTTVSSFSLRYGSPAAEESALEYFYEKSYKRSSAPGAVNDEGAIVVSRTGGNAIAPVFYRRRKRVSPNITLYSPTTGTSGQKRDVSASADTTATASNGGETGFHESGGLTSDGNWGYFHFVADARI